MAIFTFVLGLLLVAAGAGGLIGSLDLLPTEIGLLYAGCGAVALSAGVVTLAIGALIRRLDVFTAAVRALQNGDHGQISPAAAPALQYRDSRQNSPAASEPTFADAPAASEAEPDAAAAAEPVDENRSGGSPTTAAIERAPGEPEPAPTLVGRFSAGGANYTIFSDGSIEAETENGAYKFASMSDFRAYLASVRG
jgi:hypothetical protein